MKFIHLIATAIFLLTLVISGCGSSSASEAEKVADKPAEKILQLKITAGDRILLADLEDNATTRDFLKKLPTTLQMENLYGREMCYHYGAGGLTESPTRSDRYEVGDIIYWKPRGSFVILYKQNGELFERVQIGHIDGDVSFFDGADTVSVTFELAD